LTLFSFLSCAGIRRRFRQDPVYNSIYNNCRSRRLAICVKHLIKDFSVLDDVDSMLMLIISFLCRNRKTFHTQDPVYNSIYNNCRSQRLAICVKHLIKDFSVLDDVDSMLMIMLKLFDNSPQTFAVFIYGSYDKFWPIYS
jgi:hypothetical protein